MLDYVREGFLPEALINFIASLGWNDGTEQEIFSLQELIEKFSLKQVQVSGARFDEQRLTWMNGHYIRELALDDLMRRAEAYWPPEAAEGAKDYKLKVLALVQERLKFLRELPSLTVFFFKKPAAAAVAELINNPVDKKLQDLDKPQMKGLIEASLQTLRDSDFSRDDIQERLNTLIAQQPTKPAILFPLIRIGLSGSAVSPEIFGTLSVLGKDESLSRLESLSAQLDA